MCIMLNIGLRSIIVSAGFMTHNLSVESVRFIETTNFSALGLLSWPKEDSSVLGPLTISRTSRFFLTTLILLVLRSS